MFKLWFMIEYRRNCKSKITAYWNFIKAYILPTLVCIAGILATTSNKIVDSKILFQAIILGNLMIISMVHFLIQKNFFQKLEKDMIINFLPDKMYEYIRIRLIMNIIKWNLPIILASLIRIRAIFVCPSSIFYSVILLFVPSWIIINYLIAISIRYIGNTVMRASRNLGKIIISVYMLLLFILPNYMVYNFLDSLANKNIETEFLLKLNIYHVIMAALMLVLVIIIERFISQFLEINVRKLIENKKQSREFRTNKQVSKYLSLFLDLILGKKANIEKLIVTKDIKELFRENKINFCSVIIMNIIFGGMLVYFYCSSLPYNYNSAMEITVTMIIITYIFMGISFANAYIGMRKYFKFHDDRKLFSKYEIRIDTNRFIGIKRKLATILMFLYPYLSYILAFLVKANVWSGLSIGLLLVTVALTEKNLSLILIKKLNNDNSDSSLIRVMSISLVAAVPIVISQVFNNPTNIVLYAILYSVLITTYAFNYNINVNKKHKGDSINA